MSFVMPNFAPAAPEIFVLTMACLILVIDLFLTDENRVITYLLAQLTLLGAAVLTIYLGLELMSLSLYAMVALQRDSATASEAAMKYFVLGALSSGLLLYG